MQHCLISDETLEAGCIICVRYQARRCVQISYLHADLFTLTPLTLCTSTELLLSLRLAPTFEMIAFITS